VADKYALHTERVPLPSKGIPYSKELQIPPEIAIRPFLTEDQKGINSVGGHYGVDMLINNCINEPDRKYKAEDLLTSDKALLLIRLRAITLGKDFPVDYTCPTCSQTTHYVWDLDKIEINFLDLDEYPITLELPESKDIIKWRFLTDKHLEEVEDLLDSRATRFEEFNKQDERRMFRKAQSIVEINGEVEDLITKWEYYGRLPAQDSAYIDFIERELDIGPIILRSIRCSNASCKREFTVVLRTGMEFFRPKFELPKSIRTKKTSLEEYTSPTIPSSVLRQHTD